VTLIQPSDKKKLLEDKKIMKVDERIDKAICYITEGSTAEALGLLK
jgi:hypothetical protein